MNELAQKREKEEKNVKESDLQVVKEEDVVEGSDSDDSSSSSEQQQQENREEDKSDYDAEPLSIAHSIQRIEGKNRMVEEAKVPVVIDYRSGMSQDYDNAN